MKRNLNIIALTVGFFLISTASIAEEDCTKYKRSTEKFVNCIVDLRSSYLEGRLIALEEKFSALLENTESACTVITRQTNRIRSLTRELRKIESTLLNSLSDLRNSETTENVVVREINTKINPLVAILETSLDEINDLNISEIAVELCHRLDEIKSPVKTKEL